MERINSKISCRKTFEVATFQAINYIIKYLLGKLAVKIWTAVHLCGIGLYTGRHTYGNQ